MIFYVVNVIIILFRRGVMFGLRSKFDKKVFRVLFFFVGWKMLLIIIVLIIR